ncbi:hypothetical protein [Streptomyces sp. NRRL S-237]|uniref:hypothetical protein n=1 Tax=Streptomyces sp. NRRL S-237 TaxID=1463895 RepID=UPI0004CAC4E3|nr:hypothetical protein [Streptomyces sp. NRRL S-237]
MRLDDAVALAGGEAGPKLLADVLTPAGARALRRSLHILRSDAEATNPDGRDVRLVVVNSNSMACRTRRLDEGDSVVVIPLGVLARARALARRLLYLLRQDGPVTAMMGNVIDPRPDWELAPGLAPLFEEPPEPGEEDDERRWSALKTFDAESPEHETADEIADDIMELSLHYLVGHELAHLYARHDRLLTLARDRDPVIPRDWSPADLRRALEVHADIMAAVTVTHRFVPFVASSNHGGTFVSRQFFAAALLFGMYDTHRKSLTSYERGHYPHPIIRFEITHHLTMDVIEKVAPELLEQARRQAIAGWADWDQAMNALEFNCLLGRFGVPPHGDITRCLPVTTLKYGITSRVLPTFMDRDYRRGRKIADILEELRN